MPSSTVTISAENLRTLLERDLPGVLAPPAEVPTEPAAKGKKADFLTTNDTVVVAERLRDVAVYMRDTLGYAYLSDIAVVDYLNDGLLELVYRFYHPAGGGSLVIKVRVPRDNPHVPALTPVWKGANFHEREGYDLFGVIFDDHPNLQRIYMWEEFVGHPMRKDFPRQGDKYLPE
jgi:NADH-quinone oxidoreductase subunit C